MSKFKPGDRVRWADRPDGPTFIVIGPHPEYPDATVHYYKDRFPSQYGYDYDDKLELVPSPRDEAIEKAAAVIAGRCPFSAAGPFRAAEALADAGLLKY